MSKNLRLGYSVKSTLFLLSTAVIAIPTEQKQRGRNKRALEQNSSSLSQSIEDALHLDKDIKDAQNDSDSDSGSDVDDDDEDRDRNRPSGSATISPSATAAADTLPSASASASTEKFILEPSKGLSTAQKVAISGGTIGGVILIALIAFVIYRWRASKKNQGPWNDEKHSQIGGPMYQNQGSSSGPSTLFGGRGESSVDQPVFRRKESIPPMPKPPPLVLVPRGSEKLEENGQTFYLDDSNRASNLPPVYEEMRSPSQESSISQTVPYPNRNGRRKLYASFQPPPIPESPPREDGQSRFSRASKESLESAPTFRTVVSWVNYQRGRESMKEKLVRLGLEDEPPVPPTPVEFRHHPGAPVGFLAQHGRLESADLDRQYMQGQGRIV